MFQMARSTRTDWGPFLPFVARDRHGFTSRR